MQIDHCSFPDDLRYDVENGTWVRVDPTQPWTLGLTTALVGFAGRIDRIQYRPLDGVVDAGRSVATVESVRYTGPVRLPVRGVIVERNSSLLERPKLLNDSPYDRGWVVRFRPDQPGAGGSLPDASGAREALLTQIRERHVECYAAFPDLTLIEVGVECSAVLARLDEELARRATDDVILLVSDDPTSPIEMVRWEDRTGFPVLEHRADGTLHKFLVRKVASPVPRRRSVTTGVVRPAPPP